MKETPLKWEEPTPGVKILRLWLPGLEPEWPRVVILDLEAERFKEFEEDALAFDRKYKVYPDQPLLWIAHGAKLPVGRDLPPPASKSSRWRVVILHRPRSMAVCAACPHD